MSNGQAKKLNLSLHLDPATSEADSAAIAALQQWYGDTKQHQGEDDNVNMMVRSFHRDVYVAGLHLHRLHPRLCRYVAESLRQGAASVETLMQQLQTCGLLPVASMASNGEHRFSAAQLEQLEQLFAAAPTEPKARSTEAFEETSEVAPVQPSAEQLNLLSDQRQQLIDQRQQLTDQSQQLTDQSQQLTVLLTEIQQLRVLAEQQAVQLQRLKLSSNTPSPIPSFKASATEEMSVADMAPQLAQMQEIRKKGLF
jgi:hypothetical protein